MKHTPTKNELNEMKRQSEQFKGIQELCCMSLLLRHGIEFVLLKPRKITTKNEVGRVESYFYLIKEIVLKDKVISFEKLVNQEVDEYQKQYDYLPDSSHKQKIKIRKRNVVSITNNLLSDLLIQLGYNVEFSSSRKADLVVKMNRIQSISHKEIGEISKEKMMEIGSDINKKLLLSFNLLSLKRDDPLRIDSKLITNLFSLSRQYDSVVSNFFETHRHIILNKH